MKLAVCAICRNELPYVVEWVAFQKAIGFDQVFIYDNVSDDGTSELLASLDAIGEIKRVHWPRKLDVAPQRAAYAHFIENGALDFDWVFICDLDEFFVPNSGTVVSFIQQALATNPNVAAIATPWLMFGSSGAENFESGFVLERFTKCEPTPAPSVKTMFKPRQAYNMRTHICDLLVGDYVDNTFIEPEWSNKRPIDLQEPKSGFGVVHHYFTKSRQEWTKRRIMGRADRPDMQVRDLDLFNKYHSQQATNFNAGRFLPEVRTRVEKIESRLALHPAVKTSVKLLSVDGSWLIVSVEGGSADLQVRIVLDGFDELTVQADKIFADGSAGVVCNVRWLGRTVERVRISVVGSLSATDVTSSNFPSVKDMLSNAVRLYPSAEQLIYDAALRVAATQSGLELIRSLTMPQFTKYPQFGDMIQGWLTHEQNPIAMAAFKQSFQSRHGKAGEDVLHRLRDRSSYIGRLMQART